MGEVKQSIALASLREKEILNLKKDIKRHSSNEVDTPFKITLPFLTSLGLAEAATTRDA